MAYTDKQLKDATQVAYLNFIEKTIQNFIADGKKGPYTLRDLISANINFESAKKNLEYEGKNINNMSLQNLIEYSEIIDFDKQIIERLPDEALNWKIADIHDKNYENGFYGCVIETSSENAIVAFRGSEGLNDYPGLVNDWVKADFGLFKNKYTEQQKEVERFSDMLSVNGVLDKYKSISATGHSLGGNLASHFAIASAIGENRKKIFNKLDQVVNFDGPGVSKEYLDYYKNAIEKAGKKIKHYKWSLVGSALNDIPKESVEFLKIDENQFNDKLTDKIKYKTFLRHATTSLLFDENGNAIRGKQDVLSKLIHSVSVKAENVPTKFIANALLPNYVQDAIGFAASTLKKSIYQKEDSSIGFKLIGNKDDEKKYEDTVLSGLIYNTSINVANVMASKEYNKNKEYEQGKKGYNDVLEAAKMHHSFCNTSKFKETAKGMNNYYKNQIKRNNKNIDLVR